ncbi:MAG TPA: hypothetical protein VK081_11855, partial [Planctomycetota bacterium]|nr:hypothetical protein [Planctomycetota bacterium]
TTWQPEGVPISLNLAWLGDGIVFSTSQRVVQNVLTALAEKKEVLTAAKEYRAVAANVGDPDAEVEAFLNIERGMNTLFGVLDKIAQNEADFPEEIDLQGIRRAVDALGLSAVKAFGGTSTYKGNAAVSKSYILCPAPERRGLVADGSKNLDLDCLKWVPKKAVTCSATTLNLTAVWDALVDAVRAYDEQAAEGLLAHLGGVEKQMGFSIRDDLCGAFGSQMVTWSLPMQGMPGLGGGSLYNGMILVQMRDHERLLKVLESLKQVAGAMLDFGSNTRDDLTTYYVKLRGDAFADAFAGMPFNPGDLLEMLTPVFAFQNGYMVLGFSRSDVRRTVRAMTEGLGENEDIRANKAFADVLKSLDAERLVSLSFSDNRTSFESFYEMAYGFTAMVPDTVPLDMASLPDDGSFLGQHLFPSISYSYSDGNGFSSTQHGPFGPEMGLVIGAAIGAGAAAGVATAQEMRPRRR